MTRDIDKPGVDDPRDRSPRDLGTPRDLERLLQPAIDEERIAASWQQLAHARRRGVSKEAAELAGVGLPARRVGVDGDLEVVELGGRRRWLSRGSAGWFSRISSRWLSRDSSPRSARLSRDAEGGSRGWGRWFALGAATVVAAIAVYIAWPAHGGPLGAIDVAIAPGSVVDAPARRVVAFDDGSALDLASGARLQVLTNESDRFALLLLRGRARFDVRSGGARRWEIETSRATVEVVGTAFTVESDDRRVVVAVERGVVMVRGERVPGRVARLVAGDRIEIGDASTREAHASADADRQPGNTAGPANATTNAGATAATTRASTNGAVPNPPPSGRRVAATDLTRPSPDARPASVAATDPLPSQPGARATSESKKLAAILGDAEQRRASGDAAGAAELLESAVATTHDDPSLGLAEFTLGRLYLEELGAPERAAAAFAKMIALGAPHALLEDAYARRIEALVRAHRTDDARAALSEYDRLYPHGLRRAALHALPP